MTHSDPKTYVLHQTVSGQTEQLLRFGLFIILLKGTTFFVKPSVTIAVEEEV